MSPKRSGVSAQAPGKIGVKHNAINRIADILNAKLRFDPVESKW
jgi:hypothetical protein